MSKITRTYEIKIDDVNKKISPNDEMYQGNNEHYFHVGMSAIQCIYFSIMLSGKSMKDIKKILDLPCGYGRVLRMLISVFPDSSVYGCDLNHEGVDFCSRIFGATPIYSNKNIKNVNLLERFDLIWCGSLLTHLEEQKWNNFFSFFENILRPHGLLVFTTHGRNVANVIRNKENNYGLEPKEKINKMINDFEREGFGFCNYHHSDDYGISVSSPSFTIKKIEKRKNLQILMYLEKGWDHHQDVVACIKKNK